MIATIIDNQTIVFTHITPWEEEILDARFSAANPRSRYIVDTSSQHWDGVYRKYNVSKKTLARPFLNELIELCKLKNLHLDVVDARPEAKYKPLVTSIPEDFLDGITLKEFQTQAIQTAIEEEVGLFHIVTGGGKTEVMSGIVKLFNCPTFIVSEQSVVIQQISERLRLRKVIEQPGIFYAGKKHDDSIVVIATTQSLVTPSKRPLPPERSKFTFEGELDEKKFQKALDKHESAIKGYRSRLKNAKTLKDLIKLCDLLIVDEADLAVSDTYKYLFRHWYQGRRRYGLSGTPYDRDKPVQKLILQEHLGSVIFKQDQKQVESTGLIIPIDYYMVFVGDLESRPDQRAYDIAINEDIVYNQYFHNMLKGICDKHPDDGILILVERDDLGHALEQLIPNSKFLHGRTPKSVRPTILKAFERRDFNVLIGGKNIRRGLDLKGGCDVLVLASGGKLASEFDQKLGRARRVNKSGRAKVIDFLFYGNKHTYDHSRKRLKAVVGMGYKTKVVFPHTVIEGDKFIQSRFRMPRKINRQQ